MFRGKNNSPQRTHTYIRTNCQLWIRRAPELVIRSVSAFELPISFNEFATVWCSIFLQNIHRTHIRGTVGGGHTQTYVKTTGSVATTKSLQNGWKTSMRHFHFLDPLQYFPTTCVRKNKMNESSYFSETTSLFFLNTENWYFLNYFLWMNFVKS